MDENKEFIPTLTLDPNAAAATEVSAAPEAALPAEKKPEAPAEKLDIDRLSPPSRPPCASLPSRSTSPTPSRY